MDNTYGLLYEDYKEIFDVLPSDDTFVRDFAAKIERGKNVVSLNHRIYEKQIDLAWVSVIEQSMPALDKVIRNPRKFIEQKEEILPIELSRNITAESVKHLAQHTNLIQKIEGDVITPSKILNVYKEESMDTYENRFVNTLIDRLYGFLHKRYNTLKRAAADESAISFGFESEIDGPRGDKVSMQFKIETKDPTENNDKNADAFKRVERLCKIVEEYKGSSFVAEMGSRFVRPPIMRTNAIMKNLDLRQCLDLWQFIESYEKVGYEINSSETAEKPKRDFLHDLYRFSALEYLMFRRYTDRKEIEPSVLKLRKNARPLAPKFVKKFKKEETDEYNIFEVEVKKVVSSRFFKTKKKLTSDEIDVRKEIDAALTSEKKLVETEIKQKKATEKTKKGRTNEKKK